MIRIIVLALCLSTTTAFAAATYTWDPVIPGRLLKVSDVDAQGNPQIAEFRYTDDDGQPTTFVYAMRYNGGQWCIVSDPNQRSGLSACLGVHP